MNATSAICEADLVREAAGRAERIVEYHRRWHGGNKGSATSRAARRFGIPEKDLNKLLYPCRWPKEVGAGLYLKLAAIASFIDTADAKLKQELELAEADGFNAENSATYRLALAALGSDAPTKVADGGAS